MRPKSRREGVVAERIGDEVVVLDVRTSEAHYLHPLTSRVWEAADGTRDVDALVEALRAPTAPAVDAEAVRAALEALADAGLLEAEPLEPVDAPLAAERSLTRRRLLRGAALSSLAVATLPLSPALAESAPEPPPVDGQRSAASEPFGPTGPGTPPEPFGPTGPDTSLPEFTPPVQPETWSEPR